MTQLPLFKQRKSLCAWSRWGGLVDDEDDADGDPRLMPTEKIVGPFPDLDDLPDGVPEGRHILKLPCISLISLSSMRKVGRWKLFSMPSSRRRGRRLVLFVQVVLVLPERVGKALNAVLLVRGRVCQYMDAPFAF